ncbi:hypothetical protein AVEN_73633-1 [Araneus ventricosus]|uniref:Uncharacterized protein n=1 Tax=Araneus ventricosus TaxID=182803 RepID=A0A4Y2SJG4_ARAVE|nr:hypothetical protein AVEN_73633-1 [Araneus ventricosus]
MYGSPNIIKYSRLFAARSNINGSSGHKLYGKIFSHKGFQGKKSRGENSGDLGDHVTGPQSESMNIQTILILQLYCEGFKFRQVLMNIR